MASSQQTPGVYINEVNAFPNAVVPVATAVPVFIGYTMRADYKGKSYLNQAVEINSMQDFMNFYGVMTTATPPGPAPEMQQYAPIYHILASRGEGDVTIGGKPLDLLPDPSTIYYLYNSIKLFYQNGGSTAFIVSVGLIGPPPSPSKPMAAGSPLVNPRVSYDDLYKGLQVAGQEASITMISIPDAVLLKQADYATLMQNILNQCGIDSPDCCAPGSRVGLLDVYGGEAPDPELWNLPGGEIETFRTAVGMDDLRYGIAYFPFLKTTIVEDGDIDFITLGGGKELAAALPDAAVEPVKTILDQIQNPPATNPPTPLQLENALLAASTAYSQLHDAVLEKINTLPPGAAMAGLISKVDSSIGVWRAPANFSLTAVTDTTLKITDNSQAMLNVDAVSGKSINAIRLKPGFGVMVWGARTLDGNSQDWRYINVRRTMIFIEQSLKLAMQAYVFLPNVDSTWSLVQSMVTSFLTSLWSQGCLAGSSAAASFKVAIGLGLTMTPDDILAGKMNLTVSVALSHPAEFITITISQQAQS
ncbi:phage tail sheath family protein [Prosthecobacter sp.]|uniref:phage tail sheath family protein n=1 Tax=Prosthecobacter sp. TaxID=1965333 RepID=UPI0037834E1C